LPALHRFDCEARGFQWVDCHDVEQSVLTFLRWGEGEKVALVVLNFTPVVRHAYRVGVPFSGRWRERLNSDSDYYGGSNVGNGGGCFAEPIPAHGFPQSLSLTLPPFGALLFVLER
jgi:1,4-alpha-glucan branching enzyme